VFVGLTKDDENWSKDVEDLNTGIEKLQLHETLQALDREVRGDMTAPEGSPERMSLREMLQQLLDQKTTANAGTAKPRPFVGSSKGAAGSGEASR
jgi:hypothetical protein